MTHEMRFSVIGVVHLELCHNMRPSIPSYTFFSCELRFLCAEFFPPRNPNRHSFLSSFHMSTHLSSPSGRQLNKRDYARRWLINGLFSAQPKDGIYRGSCATDGLGVDALRT